MHFHSQSNFIVAWNAKGNLGLVTVSQDFANRFQAMGSLALPATSSLISRCSEIKAEGILSQIFMWHMTRCIFHALFQLLLDGYSNIKMSCKEINCVCSINLFTHFFLVSPSSKAWSISTEYGQKPDFSKVSLSEQITKLSHITSKSQDF